MLNKFRLYLKRILVFFALLALTFVFAQCFIICSYSRALLLLLHTYFYNANLKKAAGFCFVLLKFVVINIYWYILHVLLIVVLCFCLFIVAAGFLNYSTGLYMS